MGIIDKLRSLFVREKHTKQTPRSTNITRYDTSSIIIPEYTELSEEDRTTVDGYISEVDMEKLDTLIFYADEMSKYATANTDLLVKLFERITERPLSEFELSKLSDTELYETRLDTLIQREQVGLYWHGLEALERESALRATALVEIARRENKRKFDFLGLFGRVERLKRKSQTELLELVTERMKISKKTIEQQIQAVSNAEQSETVIASSIEVYNLIANTDETVSQTVLQQRVADILQMACLVIPEAAEILKEINANTTEEHIVKILARVQRKLDVYAYTHRKKLEQIRQEVLEIGQLGKTTESREELLRRINEIQIMYKIFGQYVTQEDLHNLYNVKFGLLDIEALYSEKGQNADERDYYRKLTQERLEKILKGQNKNFEDCYGENQSKAISMLRDIIKSECYEFSGKAIFSSRRILGFILAFDTEDGYKEFMRAPYFKKYFVRNLEDGYLGWAKYIPMQTIFQLLSYGALNDNFSNTERWINLINLSPKLLEYCKLNQASEIRGNRLPEGISKIYSTRSDYYRYCYSHENAILNRLKGKKVILPSSVVAINGFIPNIESIELNKELIGISETAIRESKNKFLIIRVPLQSKSVNILGEWYLADGDKHEIDTCHPAFRRDKDGATITLRELYRLIQQNDKQEEPEPNTEER